MNANTKKAAKKATRAVPPSVRSTILQTHGASAEIAAAAGVSRQYVCNVLAGRKPCSPKLWEAIVDWLSNARPARLHNALVDMARQEISAA